MNKVEKEVTQAQLKDEERALKELKRAYAQARKDVKAQISALNARTDMQNLQSIIYQRQYQQALLKQIEGVLDDLNKGQYKTMQDFLQGSYANGYIGSMYNLESQGIPMTVPIDPAKMERAIKTDSKLSKSYYQNRILPENLTKLKKSIRTELIRGIASGKTWLEVAYQIAEGMNSPFNRALNDAMRIVRTEGHRINQQGFLDAGDVAKDKGADIVKQWDATLDKATREAHRIADGQIVEWDEEFTVDGEKMKAPSVGGSAKNVCNCRCQLLQRAKWALDEDELKELQRRSDFFMNEFGDEPKDFAEFKERFLNLPENADTIDLKTYDNVLNVPLTSSQDPNYDRLLSLVGRSVDYNPVLTQTSQLTQEEIIKRISGGDMTSGSCASVGLAYIGQKQGFDVTDFRGGSSCSYFSSSSNLKILSDCSSLKVIRETGENPCTVGNRLLKHCEVGKEYYLAVGRHASIVRKTPEGKLQYLELQSEKNSGWTDFDGNAQYTLTYRFGCGSKNDYGFSSNYDFMIDIDESDFTTDEFRTLLGYINTNENDQKKGLYGSIK